MARRCLLRWLALAVVLAASCFHAATAALHSIAFHYGADAPLDELHAFDVAVVDPDHGFDPARYRSTSSELFAYVSVGEAHPSRSYASLIPREWRLGSNTAWGSLVIDQRSPAWQTFFTERIVAPLWQRGFRGFFLDTLDSYRLGGDKADPAAQQAGLAALIHGLHLRFPGIRLIANRGFELMPLLAPGEIEAIAAESLFRGWDAGLRSYREVAVADREWLLARLAEVRERYGIPTIAIDYVAPGERALARETAAKIRAQGSVPWVSDGGLSTLGVGNAEVLPRRVLIIHDGREAPGLHYREPHRYIEMPLNYFGYVADYFDANGELPEPDQGRYAGIVAWFGGQLPPEAATRYARWLRKRVSEGWRAALFGDPGFAADRETLAALGLSGMPPPAGRLVISQREGGVGHEVEPLPDRRRLVALRIDDGAGQPWLRVRDAHGSFFDGVAMMRWGGFAWHPFAVAEFSEDVARWVVDPWLFLQGALALPDLPVPDTTSDAGRRMLFAHMDGDGFPSRAEFAGRPYAAQVMLDEVVRRYPMVPHTLSIIEGEVSPQGLYPADSAALESIARKMFALPYVEISSHTYSHPFRWKKVEAGEAGQDENADYHLDLPGYTPSLTREISGSVDYVRKRLAPPGKPVRLLFWSGDAAPGPQALALVEREGLFNMNGGDTLITRANPSITRISPLGARLGDYFQVYAPVANENVFTNLWRGPFYGFRQVTETFEMTGEPRRIKPIDIYFHTYAASKRASLVALRKAYEWALAQPVRPVFASEFVAIAQSFNHVVLARDLVDGSLLVRNAGQLRSLRLPFALGEPDTGTGSGIAGWGGGPDGRYLIVVAPEARLHFGGSARQVRLAGANARVLGWSRQGDSVRAELLGHAPIEFDLAEAQGCTVSAANRVLTGSPNGRLLRFRLSDAATTLDIGCRGR